MPARLRTTAAIGVAAILLLGILGLVVVSLTPGPQPESARLIAALEVPILTPQDRGDFLAILRHRAHADGLHVDDGSQEWADFRRSANFEGSPETADVLAKTIYISVWRGSEDRDLTMAIDDGGHQGRAWISFFRGEHPEETAKSRERVISEIKARWPTARDLPITPGGGLPSADDLVVTGNVYSIRPDRQSAYAPSPAP